MAAQVLLICLLVGSAYSRPSVSRKNDEHGNFGYKYEVSHGAGSSRVHLDVGGNKAPRLNKHILDSDYQAPHHGQESYAPTSRGEDGFKHSASSPQDSGITHDPRPSYPSPYDSDSKFSPEYSPPEHTGSYSHAEHEPRPSGYEPRQEYLNKPAPYAAGPVGPAEDYSAGHPGPSYIPEQHVAQQSYQEPIDEPLHQLHDSQQNYQEPIRTPHQQLHAPQHHGEGYETGPAQVPIDEPVHQLHDSQQNYQEPIHTSHQQLHVPQHHGEGYESVPAQVPIEPVIVQKEYPSESLPVIAQEGYSGPDLPVHAPVESFPSHHNTYPSSGIKGGLPVQAPIPEEHEVSSGSIKTIPILTDSKPKYAIIPDGGPYVQIGHTAEIVHGPAPGAPISHSVPLIVDAPPKQVLGSFDPEVAPVPVAAPISHSIPLPIGAYSKPAVVVVPEVVDEAAPPSHSIRLPIPYGPSHAASDLESKAESANLLNSLDSDSKDGGSPIAVEDNHIPPVSHAFRLSLPAASVASEAYASPVHQGPGNPPVSHSFPLVLPSGPADGPQDLIQSKLDLGEDDSWDVDEELAKVQAQLSHSASEEELH